MFMILGVSSDGRTFRWENFCYNRPIKRIIFKETNLGCCMLQVEPEGEVLVELLSILDWKEVQL